MTQLATRTIAVGERLPVADPLLWLDIRLKSAFFGPDDEDPREAEDVVRAMLSVQILEPSNAPLFWNLQLEGEGVRLHPGLEEPKHSMSGMVFTGTLAFSPDDGPFAEFLLNIDLPAANRPEVLLSIVLEDELRQELCIRVTDIKDGLIEFTLDQPEPEDI